MNVAFNAASSGISAGLAMLNAAAGNIANADTPGLTASAAQLATAAGSGVAVVGSGPANSELSAQLPDACLAALMVKVNAVSMRTAMAAYSSIGF